MLNRITADVVGVLVGLYSFTIETDMPLKCIRASEAVDHVRELILWINLRQHTIYRNDSKMLSPATCHGC